MRVGLAILNADPARGGAERYTVDLARSLCERGHDVYLLATRFARDVEPARQVRLDGAAGSRIGRYRQFIQSLDQHLKQTRYDIVHAMLPVRTCDLYHPHAGIEAHNLEKGHLRHGGLFRRTISRVANRLNSKRRLYADVERELLEGKGAAVVCLSAAMEQVAQSHYDLREGQSYVLLNGVDLKQYALELHDAAGRELRGKYGFSEKDAVALFMSNNFRLKGLKQSLMALQRIAKKGRRDAKLLVVGRENTQEYQRMAQRMGIAEQVVFAGATDRPAAYYAAADFFLLPTAYDSCSLVVLEALAMGRPVITTRKNGASEAMTDGVEGFITDDQSDMEGLCEAWENLLIAGLRRKMAEAAIKMRAGISKEEHVEKLLAIYARIASV